MSLRHPGEGPPPGQPGDTGYPEIGIVKEAQPYLLHLLKPPLLFQKKATSRYLGKHERRERNEAAGVSLDDVGSIFVLRGV